MGFANDTTFLMFDGSTKKVHKLKIGDKIMGTDSKPKIIKEITKDKTDMYEIIPHKGKSYTVSGNHILLLKVSNYELVWWDESRQRYVIRWIEDFSIIVKMFSVKKFGKVKSSSKSSKKKSPKQQTYEIAKRFLKKEVPKIDGYVKYGDVVSIKVCDFMELPKHVQAVFKGFSMGVEFAEQEIAEDPYLLGYWLGDGTSATSEITTVEPEVLDYFVDYAEENGLVIRHYSEYRYTLTTGTDYGGEYRNVLMNFLKAYELLNNKHIPREYLINSRENRLRLLAGLVDSDGCYNHNSYEFIFKSEKLVDDTIFLARSLGFKAFKKNTKKTCTNGKNGPVTGNYFSFIIHGEGLEDVPSLLERKQAHERESKRNAAVTNIKVKHIGKKDCYHIKCKNGGRILLDEFTVTHC